MKSATVALFFASAPSTLGLRTSRNTITPTQQVISMMTEMKTKATKALETEQKVYATYKEWVSDRTQELGFEIKTAESDIEKYLAFIEKAENKIAVLTKEIAGLDADMARLNSELKDATTVRQSENAEYQKMSTDFGESVDALERALQVMKAQAYDRPQAEMLLQKMAKNSPALRPALAAFLQQKGYNDGAPEVAAYDFQSDGIITMLEGLLKKFQEQLDQTNEDESNAAHEYEILKIHINDVLTKTQSDREQKAATKASTIAASAKAKGDLADTRKEKAADEKTLADMQATFAAKSDTYAQNQEVRKGELEALGKAIEIISSPEVSGSYSEHVNLAQTSFLQVQAHSDAKRRVTEFLKKRAGALSSKALAALADQVAENPFGKVITMIEDLVSKLKEEAAAEKDHKAWCDEQLKKNKLKRNERTAAVNKLTAEVAEYASNIETMGATIDTLVKEQAELAKAMAEATDFRNKEKATNLDTIADAQAGASAVKKALEILREFYSSVAFVQQVPEMAEYKGLQGKNKGVIGMLEVILTDFTRLETDTKAAEAQAAKEYAEFMADSKASKLAKHNAEVKLRLEKDQAEFEKGETEKELASNEEQLALAKKYFEYLKPNCLEIHVSYEERVARRKEEIEALKQAYAILDSKKLGLD